MRYGPFRVAECFFAMSEDMPACDLLRCRQFPQAAGLDNVEPQSTLLIDLSPDTEELFSRINKDVRYDIRRAESKDGVHCQLLTSQCLNDMMIDKLCREYATFAKEKGIPSINRKRLDALREQDELYIGIASHPECGILAAHIYLLAHGRARLLYSHALLGVNADKARRALVGRANRLLHWADIEGFKLRGAHLYDFGGYYMGQTDQAKLRINSFKADFGGELSHDYNGMIWLGAKGELARILWRFKGQLSR